jgi:hypothetical protein
MPESGYNHPRGQWARLNPAPLHVLDKGAKVGGASHRWFHYQG